MPELAEVEWYRKQWNPGLGQAVVDLALRARKRIFRETDTQALRAKLLGQKLLRSTARGKQMLFQFSGDNWLGLHLGMTGTLRVEPPDYRAQKHDHLVLYQTKRALVFRDSRQFGRVRFHHGRDEPDWWKSDVPEIVSPLFDRKFVDQFLDRHRRAPIKAVILLQNGFPESATGWPMKFCGARKILPSYVPPENYTARTRDASGAAPKFVVRDRLKRSAKIRPIRQRHWLISPEMESERHLPDSSHAAQPRHYRRPHDRVVSEMPKVADGGTDAVPSVF